LSFIEYELGNYDAALSSIEEAQNLITLANDMAKHAEETDLESDYEEHFIQISFLKAIIYEKQGQIQLAEELYLKDLTKKRKSNLSVSLVDSLGELAGFYMDNGYYDKARNCIEELNELQKTMQSDYKYITPLLSKGQLYLYDNDFELALECLREANKLAQDTPTNKWKGLIRLLLARAEYLSGSVDNAIELTITTLRNLKEANLHARALRVFLEAASLFKYLNQNDLADRFYKFVLDDPRSSYREREIATAEINTTTDHLVSETLVNLVDSAIDLLKNLNLQEQVANETASESTKQSDVAPTDLPILNDSQWNNLKELLPPQPTKGRKRKQDREVLNSYLYKLKTGKTYKDIPKNPSYASASTTQRWIEAWRKESILTSIESELIKL